MMMSETDLELLGRYTGQKAEEAFGELVRRHLNLVYSAALRQVRSPQLAEEVAQSTFVKLARKAAELAPNTILTAWLYEVTHREAIDVVRREARRQLRERIATEMNALNVTADDWRQIEPILDEAMQALDEGDRAAVLLRYFENKSLREVGQSLGASEDAAQKRVSRAVERLREFFSKNGVAVGTGGLAVMLSASAVQAAPAGMAGMLSSAALASATAGGGTATFWAFMATTKIKIAALGTLALVSTVTTVVIEKNSQAKLRQGSAAVQQQQARLAEVQAEHAQFANLIATTDGPFANTPNELQRLRDEAALLRQQTNQLAALREEYRQLQASVADLRQSQGDPNMQIVQITPEMTVGISSAKVLSLAARMYANDHQGQFPTNLAQAESCLAQLGQKTNVALAQFEFVYHGTMDALTNYAHPGAIMLVRPKEALKDPDGKLAKSYGWTDGSGQLVGLKDGNFEAWERRHIAPAEPPHR